ncbi:Diaminopimelate decarboxylase [compost metagenome]
MADTRIRFEIGRFISAACGYYLMQVLDIKRNHGQYFAVARGGTHHFRTPAAQGHDHPFVVMRGERAADLQDQAVTLVGQLCTPKDVLARQHPVNELAVGDLLVFTHAGAYAWNISHQRFLMHEPPEMIFLAE